MSDNRQQSRLARTIDLLRTVMDPSAGSGIPPALFEQKPTLVNNVSVEMDLTVGDDSLTVLEQVGTQTGLLFQFLELGSVSIYAFGIVPKGAQSVIANGNVNPSIAVSIPTQADPTVSGTASTPLINGITYIGETAVPFKSGANGITVNIAPNLPQNYSETRTYASYLQAINNTIATGTADLNGTFAVAAIADTRGPLSCPTDGSQVYSPTQLCQSAMTTRDGIRNIRGERGVTAIMGPDMPFETGPPNATISDLAFSGWTLIPDSAISYTPSLTYSWSGATPTQIYAYPVPMMVSWVSPWNTQAQYNRTSAGTPTCNQFTGATSAYNIGELDAYDIGVRYSITFSVPLGAISAIPSNFGGFYYEVVATHYFAVATTTGALQYTVVPETLERNTISCGANYNWVSWTGLEVNDAVHRTTLPKFFQTDFTTVGKYIGTLVAIQVGRMDCVLLNGTITANLSNVNLLVKARQLYRKGELSARIFRWDNMSIGSNLRFEGTMLVQAVPSATTQSLVKNVGNNASAGSDISQVLFLAAVFNYSPLFARVFPNDKYNELTQIVKNLSPDEFFTRYASHPQTVAAFEAAGFFDDLLSSLGNAARGVGRFFRDTALPYAQENIFPAIGQAVAPVALGIAGRLGNAGLRRINNLGDRAVGQIDGMFAAGEFGAAGQFGASGSMCDMPQGQGRRLRSDY